MNDSLSIDEIIKQAEEIREKTVKKAQSALEDVNNSAKEITEREIEVPKPEPENIKIASKSDKSSLNTVRSFLLSIISDQLFPSGKLMLALINNR